MQAKTETHGFLQLPIQEAFSQGNIGKSELMLYSFRDSAASTGTVGSILLSCSWLESCHARQRDLGIKLPVLLSCGLFLLHFD